MPILIVATGLLTACGEDKPTAAPANNATIVNSGAGKATSAPLPQGKIGPTVGAGGQITVVAPPASGANLPGLFVWVNQNNVWIGGTNSQTTSLTATDLGGKALTKVEPLALATSPSISPDASKVAYAYSPEPTGTPGNVVIGQDIWVYDLKSNQAKILIQRDEPQTFLDEPIWSQDGKYVYFSYRSPLRDAKNVVIGEKIGIDRFEIATGKREKLTEDARYPAPMPDGKSVVYVATDASGGTYDTELKILDITSKQSKTLLGKNSNFVGYYAPRPSPNGDLIVFSGVGGPDTVVPDPNAPLPGQNPAAPAPVLPTPTKAAYQSNGLAATGLLQNMAAGLFANKPLAKSQKPDLHGLPFDLWTIKPDGSGVTRLTTLFEDQPVPAWSKNGKQVVFLAGLGLYSVDVDTKNLSKKSDRGSHGGFDWKE